MADATAVHVLDGPGSTLARRLAALGGVKCFPCTFSKFPDGSDFIEMGGFKGGVNAHAGKHVVYCMPHTNNDVVMQSLHALTMLLESFVASLTVVSPFVPSATMERVTTEGVVATASTLSRILSGLPSCGPPVRYIFYELHTLQHRFYFHNHAVADLRSAADAVCAALHGEFDLAFFPDAGALKRFGPVLESAGLWTNRLGTCDKVRRGDERIITVQGDHDLQGKRVLLIDDLVRTGGTLLQSARALRQLGASSVSAFCAHAAGSVEELQRLARDGALDALYLTDTVETTVRRLVQSAESPRFFFRVASIAPIVHADLFRTARPHVAFENTPPATAQVQTDQAQTFQAKVQAQGGAEADGDAKAQAQAQPQTQAQVHAQDGGEAQAQAQAQVQAHVQAEVQAKAAGQGEAADQVQVQDQVQDQVQEQVQEQGASVLNQQSEIRVCVCSESEIKVQAVGDALRRMGWSGVQVVPLADCASGVRAQPQTYQETVRGCTTRLATGMRMCKPEGPCDLCVAIENGIDERSGNDFAFVVVTDSEGDSASASSTSVPVPPAAVAASGTHQTYADILFETGPYTKDPHQALCGVSRAEILALTVRVAVGRLPRWRRPI